MNKTVQVRLHHNTQLSLPQAESLATAAFTGATDQDAAIAAGVSQGTASKWVRRIEVPADYPESEDEWREDIKRFLRIASWKAVRRLAVSGVEQMPLSGLSVAAAILVDKHNLLAGNGVTTHLHAHVTVSQGDLEARILGLKRAQGKVTDPSKPLEPKE